MSGETVEVHMICRSCDCFHWYRGVVKSWEDDGAGAWVCLHEEPCEGVHVVERPAVGIPLLVGRRYIAVLDAITLLGELAS